MLETKHYRELLEGEKKRVIKLLGWADASLLDRGNAQIPDGYPDSGDNDELPDGATETFFQELDAAFGRRYRDKLNGVQAALQRIEVGSYGRCVICGKAIEPKRLETLPETPFCFEDAQADEALE